MTDSNAQHGRRGSADKARDLEGGHAAGANSPYNLDYQPNMPGMSILPALDSTFPEVQQLRRKETGISKFRSQTREFWDEFFGTAVLVLFGTAVNHQVNLASSTNVVSGARGDWTTVSLNRGVAVMLGVVVSGGISGGHINPAVTLTLALLRGFSWKKVPVYWLAQFTGAFFGAGLTYLNYSGAISLYEGGPNIRTVAKTGGLYSHSNYLAQISIERPVSDDQVNDSEPSAEVPIKITGAMDGETEWGFAGNLSFVMSQFLTKSHLEPDARVQRCLEYCLWIPFPDTMDDYVVPGGHFSWPDLN